ncbi:MAG: 50S ribosomal protein L18a [Methanocalculus sp. MSAO_Arc1]|uniref:50S ribosomal protein L18Ae n=1 Tax=Methanocalculus TaxID=71151 RepID=UPI000FF160CD|nr:MULTISPECIES: 50S ribosomal protein L18Ae [unclassified Methanocalculus]MCP1662056.1 large subunit ribosomal protein LX [Methanocalculus sp. AMF5]RQD80120.1 MAG: 50S ribosomal protein L18a [Methanocalculus sp. MSAO_Arc1]
MELAEFEVRGTMKIGDAWKPYIKVIEAPNEAQARERIYTLMGSKHRLERRLIKIESVEKVNGE